VLKIDGTFLPQTGEDFWAFPLEELSHCCGCVTGTDELALAFFEVVIELPPVDGEWLLEDICCPCGGKADLELCPNDIWLRPCGALPCCWEAFL
jgi:hypothetical protein